MKTNKKAQAAFVAYVLLIGLSVTLAVIVGRWGIEQAQKSSESVIRRDLIEDRCNQVAIGAFLDCADINNVKINVSNRGNLIINGIKSTGGGTTGCLKEDINENIKPGKSTLIKIPSQDLNNCNTALILPLIDISEDQKNIGCTEKRIELKLICS